VQVVMVVHHDGRAARQLHTGIETQLDLSQDKLLVGVTGRLEPVVEHEAARRVVHGKAVERGEHALAR